MTANIAAQVLNTGGKPTRKMRRPAFPISGTMKPFGLYPLMAHPVLPGETLQSATIKMKTTSMPLVNPVAGAWLETWLVYVKLTDLDKSLGETFISDDVPTTGYTASSDSERYFCKSGQVDWIRLCTERFHAAYFRHETETPEALDLIDGVPQVKLNNSSWYENMILKPADTAVDTSNVGDMYAQAAKWRQLQQMQMTELTYEKYLEQYGAKPARETEGDPEILRFARSWVTPAVSVEPSTGTPTSAWVWRDEVAMSEAKRFTEPGFVLAFAAVRPKMYQAHVDASLVGELWGFSDWYPIYNQADPSLGIKTISSGSAVFASDFRTDSGDIDLLYDHRDLLDKGETFINNRTDAPFAPPMSTGMLAQDASSTEAIRGEYALAGDISALFSASGASNKVVYYDGLVSFKVNGHVTDGTPM